MIKLNQRASYAVGEPPECTTQSNGAHVLVTFGVTRVVTRYV